jgi:hypothetical protein
MVSGAPTEIVKVPPIINKNSELGATGRDSAFSKRLPEI